MSNKFCKDCIHYAPPRIIEAEEKRLAETPWWSIGRPHPYSHTDYWHRCMRHLSPVTGEVIPLDAEQQRLWANPDFCSPRAKFFKAKP